jgi:hypothetical protein
METDTNQDDLRPSFSPGKKWSIGISVFFSVVSLMALVVMLNYLAHRHNERFPLSYASKHKLTPLTLQVLANLTNSVKVTVFFDRREPLFGSVSSLIKEYQSRAPKLDVEFVDYRMPGRAETIRNQYKITSGSDNSRVIFDSGGQVRTVLSTELSEYNIGEGKEIKRTGFRGEQLFTSAILNVTQNKPVNAYFLKGHGEHEIGDDDNQRGYSLFARLLENNNVQVKALTPLVGTEIPSDCTLLVIPGPTHPLETQELAKIDKYLSGGGRLFILFNFEGMRTPTGLEQLLQKWNVDVGFNWVQDSAQSEAGEQAVLLTSNYGAHPIVRPLLRSSLKFVTPRSISQRQVPATSADAPKAVELVSTGPNGMAIVPPQEGSMWTKVRSGVIPLAVAVERGAIQAVGAERSATRIVVTGDSLFLSNLAFNQAANGDFGNLAVNWLVNRDSLLNEIGPSPVSEYQILLTETQMSQLRWLFLGVIPGVVMTFGFFVWLRRRA